MLFFGRLDAAKGWTKQLHLGAIRNNNARLLSVWAPMPGSTRSATFRRRAALARYLDRLDSEGCLPKTVLYNVNPADNYVFATMIGNVQDDLVPGKIQFGSGWWFLDQKDGIEWQLNALSQLGLLSRFVGMLTDSRSFLSYVRHEYFRRVLCAPARRGHREPGYPRRPPAGGRDGRGHLLSQRGALFRPRGRPVRSPAGGERNRGCQEAGPALTRVDSSQAGLLDGRIAGRRPPPPSASASAALGDFCAGASSLQTDAECNVKWFCDSLRGEEYRSHFVTYYVTKGIPRRARSGRQGNAAV